MMKRQPPTRRQPPPPPRVDDAEVFSEIEPSGFDSSGMQREIAILRLLFQMNARLRLEILAALSKTFRDHGVSITDSLLSAITFAISDELPGESNDPPSSGRPMGSYGGQPPIPQPPSGHAQPPQGHPAGAQPPTQQQQQPPQGRPSGAQPPTQQPQPPQGRQSGQPPTPQPPTSSKKPRKGKSSKKGKK